MLRLLAISLLCLVTAGAAADALLDEAQGLLDAGRPDAAYELLKAEEGERAGEPQFDYLLGIAALDAGNPVDAVFALERAVDLAPDNGPARAELARAYLALGETDDARGEFDKVKAMELPADVRETIDRYLSSIDVFHDATRTRFRPWFQVGVGYDTNVNSATDQNLVAVPALGGLVFTLSGTSVEENSPLWAVGGGVRFTSPLDTDRGLSLFGRIGLDHRLTVDEADFSSTLGDGRLGLHLRHDKHQFRLSADANIVKVDGSSTVRSDRETAGFTGQWQYSPDEVNQFTTFAQFSIVRYPDQRVRDVNRATVGTGWGHAFTDAPGRPVLFVSGFGGIEDDQSESRGAHFGRSFFGARLGGQVSVHERGTLFATLTYQASDYDDDDPLFLKKRDDNFYDVNAGYRFQYDRHWSLTPTIRYSYNDSNIVTNEYDRFELMVMLRNDF